MKTCWLSSNVKFFFEARAEDVATKAPDTMIRSCIAAEGNREPVYLTEKLDIEQKQMSQSFLFVLVTKNKRSNQLKKECVFI